jgi:hypothetical protein
MWAQVSTWVSTRASTQARVWTYACRGAVTTNEAFAPAGGGRAKGAAKGSATGRNAYLLRWPSVSVVSWNKPDLSYSHTSVYTTPGMRTGAG